MQQMTENPQLMQNMLSAPYTQSVLQSLSQNPDMAANIIGSNPLFAGNPELQQEMRNMMPRMMQQLQNPEVQGVVTNPEAMRAIMQIQEGLQRLRQVAPEFYSSMGMPSVATGLNLIGNAPRLRPPPPRRRPRPPPPRPETRARRTRPPPPPREEWISANS